MEQFLNTETLIIELLLVASLVALAVQRVKVPYTVSLVVVGLLITYQADLKFELTPELILALFVPPLVFEAAFHLQLRHLRENLVPILVLAIPGVVLTTLIVAFVVSLGTGLSFTNALVFGALISATDPVAVVALFRSLGAPSRLTTLVEGESLFNDGTSIVIFNLMLAIALPVAGSQSTGSIDIIGSLITFMFVSIGGILIGFGLGWVGSQLIARIDDYLVETTITTVLAFGSYLIADRLHLSGVLAVVGAGLICGNFGPRGMSPTTRIVLFNFWEYLAFIANSLIFLLIGLDINLGQIIDRLVPILIAIAGVLVSRLLVVYGLSLLLNLIKPPIPFRYQHVLFWGGLRGAVSLALVLGLPASFADRELLRVMAYGVVLFTLLGQGTTMQFLLRKLGLIKQSGKVLEYERRHGRYLATRAGRERANTLFKQGLISAATWESLDQDYQKRLQEQSLARQSLLDAEPTLQQEEKEDARRESLQSQRAMLTELQGSGVISDSIYAELAAEFDAELEASGETRLDKPGVPENGTGPTPSK